MGVRRAELPRLTNLIGALAAVIAVVGSGCDAGRPPAPDPSLNSVEINGDRLSLPQTQLVTCTTPEKGQHLFSWQGSDTLVPRRPLEEKYWSSMKLRFAPDAPVPQVLALQVFWHGKQLNLDWPSADDLQHETLTLNSSGSQRYLLMGSLPAADAASPQYYVRVEFNC